MRGFVHVISYGTSMVSQLGAPPLLSYIQIESVQYVHVILITMIICHHLKRNQNATFLLLDNENWLSKLLIRIQSSNRRGGRDESLSRGSICTFFYSEMIQIRHIPSPWGKIISIYQSPKGKGKRFPLPLSTLHTVVACKQPGDPDNVGEFFPRTVQSCSPLDSTRKVVSNEEDKQRNVLKRIQYS